MKTPQKITIQIGLGLGAIYLIWGSTYLAIRLAIETIPPYLMSGTRFAASGILLYLWARNKETPSPNLSQWKAASVVGALMVLGGNGSVVWAEQFIPSGIAALLISTVPLWMVLLNWLWLKGDRPGGLVIIGVLLGLGGIALLVGQSGFSNTGFIDPVGAIVLVLAAISWAAGSLFSRKSIQPEPPLLGTAMQMISGGMMMVAVSLLAGEWNGFQLAQVSMTSFFSWIYLGIFGSLIGFTCYIWLLKVAPAEKVSTYAYVNPVVAVFLGWVVADEVFTSHTFWAAGIIVGAVVLIISGKKKTD